MAKRGRPTKEPSAEARAKVADLLAKKVPVSDIAAIFQMSPPTLRKYFRAEFFTGKKIAEKSKPSREVTDALRDKVKRYLGYGMEPEDVALAIGYHGEGEYENFRADYALELRVGRAIIRAATIDRLVNQSDGGLISATTKLEALSRPIPTKEGPAVTPSEYRGKKTAALADAATAVSAGGKFAPRSSPRLAAVNGHPVEKPD
jgi:AraC-like DNA-binding protein